jgi:hypothetical protein
MLSWNVFGPFVTKSVTLCWNVFGPSVTKEVTLSWNVFGPLVKKSVTLVCQAPIDPVTWHRGIGEQLTVLSGAAAAGAAAARPAALISPAMIRVFFIVSSRWRLFDRPAFSS